MGQKPYPMIIKNPRNLEPQKNSGYCGSGLMNEIRSRTNLTQQPSRRHSTRCLVISPCKSITSFPAVVYTEQAFHDKNSITVERPLATAYS
ncbi:Uncharacterized protein HZ326_16420 [Fusarium oxysporum f. sp. albedinis]|nr:Uncharacterized protein HZ326_16420 [Fusarium oxysporum f. sp. albedinis]